MAESANKRIAKNTLSLYIRQIVSILLGLFSIKITFSVLGEQDYGINGVVGGILSVLSFLQSVMSSGSQRFFSMAVGLNDQNYLKKLFATTQSVYLIILVIMVVFGETVGLWFVNCKLNIPSDRLVAANWIYQITVISTCIYLILAPFLAAIFAHEDMCIYAKLTVLDAIMRICILSGLYFIQGDKLILLGVLGFLSSCLYNAIYLIYCLKRYPECHSLPSWDKKIVKELLRFNGWNLFGTIAWIGKNQGTAIMLNLFFGPIVNAAQSMASTIRGHATTLGNGFGAAIKPQIMKNYARGEFVEFFNLVYRGAKTTFFLVGMITFPLLFVLQDILNWWLGDVSSYMVTFTQLILLETTFEQMSTAIANANQATGRIAIYQFLIGLVGILNIPISYVFLKIGYSANVVFVISLLLQLIIIAIRFIFLERIQKGQFFTAISRVFIPCVVTGLLSIGICCLLQEFCITNCNFIVRGSVYFVITCLVMFILGFTKNERNRLIGFALSKISIRKLQICKRTTSI
jgi:O-antigen/teichoic acid export membrane protein